MPDHCNPGSQLELFIPKLKNGVKPAEEMELRVVDEDTVLVPADGEMIMAAKVLDKCDEGRQFWSLHWMLFSPANFC